MKSSSEQDNKPVSFQGAELPYEFFEDISSKDIPVSPAAIFNPVAAAKHLSPWENSTKPSISPKRKTLIITKSALAGLDTLDVEIRLCWLKALGFNIYVTCYDGNGQPIAKAINTDETSGKLLPVHVRAFDKDEDYLCLAEHFAISKDSCCVIDHVVMSKLTSCMRDKPTWHRACLKTDLEAVLDYAEDHIEEGLDLANCMEACQNDAKKLQLLNEHEGVIKYDSGLAACMAACPDGTRTRELLEKHEHLIRNDHGIASCIKACPDDASALALFRKHVRREASDKAIRSIAVRLDAEQILQLINEYEDTITDGDRLSAWMALCPDKAKTLALLNKYGGPH